MNKKVIYSLCAVIALLLGYIIYSNLTHSHSHDHGDEHGHAHAGAEEKHLAPGSIKEVELNEAQFQNAKIELGAFSIKNLSETISANGFTKLPPQNQADVTSFVSGTIQTIKAVEGEYVKKGQTLATIQSLEYNNLRLEKAKLEEELDASATNKKYLELEFARQKELSDENVNAKKAFQKVSSELEFENKKTNNLRNQIAILDQSISVGGAAQSPILSITAPISGYITEINCKIGSTAEAGKPLMSIVDNSQIHLDLLVFEKDLYKVQSGQTVRFTLSNQNNVEVKGKVFSIGKSFEPGTKSIAVHANIINQNPNLIPGMYVNAFIEVGPNTLKALPKDAIVKADGREFVFILEEDTHKEEGVKTQEKSYHFQRIEVKTGTEQLGFIEATILQNIPENSKIALSGAYYIQSHLIKSEGGGGHSH